MDLELRNKVAIICVGSTGIGYAIARRLSQEGARLLIWAPREEKLEGVAQSIRDENDATVLTSTADITNPDDNLRVISEAMEAFGKIDILVHHDAEPSFGSLLEFDAVSWDQSMQQYLLGVVRTCHAAIPHLRAAGGGRIINIATCAPQQRPVGLGFGASQGLVGYAKALALEVGPDNITVNTVCTGLVEPTSTPRESKTPERDITCERQPCDALLESIPLRRIGMPDDVASAVAFLVSPHASYITGVVLPVDGGRSASLL